MGDAMERPGDLYCTRGSVVHYAHEGGAWGDPFNGGVIAVARAWRGVIEEYREFLPVDADTPVATLREGNTPLIPAERIAGQIADEAVKGGSRAPRIELYVKYEGVNPTGSFKDRGMTMAISKAIESGAPAVMCASTGNTSASAAAYSARAGLRCIVLIPDGAIAMGKLAQAMMHGATVVAVKGNFDDALAIVRKLTSEHNIALVNSVNPYRIEGQKSAAFEVVDQLGAAPDYLAIPVGNAGNITAYWKGFKEYKAAGRAGSLPRMIGFQAAGAAPIVRGEPVPNPETVATAIRIGNPASWTSAVAAARESRGFIEAVTDEEILEAYGMLASTEGIFAEPASCAPLAGVIRMIRTGRMRDGERVVVVLTGHGLKDPQIAIGQASGMRQVSSVEASADAVARLIGI
ncbi:MAG: threonine synthase [Clostridia bacterium]|nr:threonine synthase [Clostridia bacterium]